MTISRALTLGLFFAAASCSRGGADDGNHPHADLAGSSQDLRMPGDSDGGGGHDLGQVHDLSGPGGPDLSGPVVCTASKAPDQTTTQTTTDNIPNPDEPYVFSVGSSVYTAMMGATRWQTWTGTGWSEMPIPWPTEITRNPDGSMRSPRIRSIGFRGVKELADGRTLFMAVDGSDQWLVTFDGATVRDPIKLTGEPLSATRTRDGRYQVLAGGRLTGGDPAKGWDTGTPVPMPTVAYTDVDMAATSDDRVVIVWTATAGSGRHVFVLSKPAGGIWGAAQDITPMWAVSAGWPLVAPSRDGGLVVAASGGSLSYTVPAVWRSKDALTFGTEDTILTGFVSANVLAIRANCLDQTLVALHNTIKTDTNTFEIYGRSGTGWTLLDSASGPYLEGAGCTAPANGRTFWGYAVPNSITLKATK